MIEKRRVLITGAMGRIGRALTTGLAETYTLRLHDLKPDMAPDGFDFAAADITSFEAVRPMMEGIDTVVHLAGNPSVEAEWESILNANIIGTRNVLEAARKAGVRRVVFASSNHAMGIYDRDGEWPVYHTMPVRPDSLYGASKAMGEVLGRHYHDAFELDFIALRIGWYADEPSKAKDQPVLRAMWLGPNDTINIVRGAIETGTTFGIYYAVSNNPDRRWDITNTMIELGYRPVDRWDEATGLDEDHAPGSPMPREEWP